MKCKSVHPWPNAAPHGHSTKRPPCNQHGAASPSGRITKPVSRGALHSLACWLATVTDSTHTPLAANLLTFVLNLAVAPNAVAPDIIVRNVNTIASICIAIYRLLAWSMINRLTVRFLECDAIPGQLLSTLQNFISLSLFIFSSFLVPRTSPFLEAGLLSIIRSRLDDRKIRILFPARPRVFLHSTPTGPRMGPTHTLQSNDADGSSPGPKLIVHLNAGAEDKNASQPAFRRTKPQR